MCLPAATSQALRASVPTLFGPTGHFPLTGGIGLIRLAALGTFPPVGGRLKDTALRMGDGAGRPEAAPYEDEDSLFVGAGGLDGPFPSSAPVCALGHLPPGEGFFNSGFSFVDQASPLSLTSHCKIWYD